MQERTSIEITRAVVWTAQTLGSEVFIFFQNGSLKHETIQQWRQNDVIISLKHKPSWVLVFLRLRKLTVLNWHTCIFLLQLCYCIFVCEWRKWFTHHVCDALIIIFNCTWQYIFGIYYIWWDAGTQFFSGNYCFLKNNDWENKKSNSRPEPFTATQPLGRFCMG